MSDPDCQWCELLVPHNHRAPDFAACAHHVLGADPSPCCLDRDAEHVARMVETHRDLGGNPDDELAAAAVTTPKGRTWTYPAAMGAAPLNRPPTVEPPEQPIDEQHPAG